MLSENSIKLNIEIRPSFLFFTLISLFNIGLLCTGLLIVNAAWQAVLISMFSMLSFFYYANLYLLRRRRNSVFSVMLDSKNNWHVEYYDKKFKQHALDQKRYVSSGLIVLYFKTSQFKKIAVPLFIDAISKENFYQLKKYLLNK